MTVGHENVAIGRDDDVGGLIERVRAGAADAGLAERHQYLPIRVELEDLIPLAAFGARIGHPEITLAVERRPMWEVEQSFSPGLEELAVRVVLQNRWLAATDARVVEAAFDHVDRSIGRTLHRGHRRPFLDGRRQLAPVSR